MVFNSIRNVIFGHQQGFYFSTVTVTVNEARNKQNVTQKLIKTFYCTINNSEIYSFR